jgi:predicted RNA-binding Zn ribbon-like protein
MSESRERSPFPAVGGHPGFDLVDTVHWRLDSSRAIDTLAEFDDVVAWCAQMGVVDDDALAAATAADPDAAAREFRAIVALREAIYEAVFTSSESAAHLIAEEYVAARGRSTLQHDAGTASWRWRVPGDVSAPRAAMAVLAHDLITSDLHAARQCADDACGWVYLDTSPRHNRIWCTAAGCGNRNRVARHAARKGA